MRRLLTLGQPHRNTALWAHLQSRRVLALLVVLVLCVSAFVLAANEAWAKEQPSPAAQQGPAEGKNTPNGQANGKVAEPVSGTPAPSVTPSATPSVTPPASQGQAQGQPAVTPPIQTAPVETPPVETPPVENAPPPPKSETETPPPAETPSSPPLEPAPATPKPDPAPQPTTQPAPQAGAGVEEDVESDPVPNASQPPMTGSDRVIEPEPVRTASPGILDEIDEIVHDLAPAPAPAPATAPATPAAADEGHAAGPAPDPVLPLPAPVAAAEQVLPAASEGLATLVRGLVAEPPTPPATAPMAQWGDGGQLTTFTNNIPAAAVAAAVPAAPVVGEALRLSAKPVTRAAGALDSAVGTVQSAATTAAASVASATAEVFRILAGGSAGTPSSGASDATSGNQQAPSDGTTQDPVAPLVPPLGDSLFSPFTGAAGQLAGAGGVAPLLVGILALLTVSLTRRGFRTYLIACELPKPSSALLRPLERPG